MINHVRLLLYVADERGMIGGTPPLEPRHLGKWVVLVERWPDVAQAVRQDPSILQRVEQSPDSKNLTRYIPGLNPSKAPVDLQAFLQTVPRLGLVAERLVYCLPAETMATSELPAQG
jgi:hypothetical protein